MATAKPSPTAKAAIKKNSARRKAESSAKIETRNQRRSTTLAQQVEVAKTKEVAKELTLATRRNKSTKPIAARAENAATTVLATYTGQPAESQIIYDGETREQPVPRDSDELHAPSVIFGALGMLAISVLFIVIGWLLRGADL